MHITFLFYDGMTALDAIVPYEILTRVPDVDVHRLSLRPGVITTCSGLKLIAEEPLADIIHTDVLLMVLAMPLLYDNAQKF